MQAQHRYIRCWSDEVLQNSIHTVCTKFRSSFGIVIVDEEEACYDGAQLSIEVAMRAGIPSPWQADNDFLAGPFCIVLIGIPADTVSSLSVTEAQQRHDSQQICVSTVIYPHEECWGASIILSAVRTRGEKG